MSKLGTSLRNSITAEKQSIAQKDLPIKPLESKSVQQKAAKVDTSKKNTHKKLAIQKPFLAKPEVTMVRDNFSLIDVRNRLHNEVLLNIFTANLDYLKNMSLATVQLQDIFTNVIQSKFYRYQQAIQNIVLNNQ